MNGPQLELPAAVGFTILGASPVDGTGVLKNDGQKLLLTTETRFPFSSGSSSQRILQSQINGVPALITATVIVKDRKPALRVTQVRYGSDSTTAQYKSIRAVFEHAQTVAAHRSEDGPGRFAKNPLNVPALGEAKAMTMRFPLADAAVELIASDLESWDQFETHLSAFQDLLTFAANSPAGCISITAIENDGTPVTIYETNRFQPFGKPKQQPIEHVVRLGGEHAQSVITGWWTARDELRPIPQILAGLRYQASYVEADLILLAAALERFAKLEHEVQKAPPLTPSQLTPIKDALRDLKNLDDEQKAFVQRALKNKPATPFLQDYLEVLLDSLGDDVLERTRICRVEWCSHFRWARNDIAHEGAPNNKAGERYVTDAESRAVRDATWVLLSLSLLQKWDVPHQAVLRAAERFGNRYASHRKGTTVFR